MLLELDIAGFYKLINHWHKTCYTCRFNLNGNEGAARVLVGCADGVLDGGFQQEKY